jgi:aminoglycoside 6-adenylyltransferase
MHKEASIAKRMERKVREWALAQPEIRVILVIGSRARRDHPGDKWADLDLMLFATDFKHYPYESGWLSQFGEVLAPIAQQTGKGDPEWLVLFDDFFKVDFVFLGAAELERLSRAETLGDEYQRGYYVLVDKDGWAPRLPQPAYVLPPSDAPTEKQYSRLVETFWYGAVYVTKQIWRKELWIVKYRDWTMKEQLLTMIEWHARAMNGSDYDTWHDGRFLPEWADSRTVLELYDSFGRFDAADSWRALHGTMRLFRRIALETADKLSYSYPILLDERVTQFFHSVWENSALGGLSDGNSPFDQRVKRM